MTEGSLAELLAQEEATEAQAQAATETETAENPDADAESASAAETEVESETETEVEAEGASEGEAETEAADLSQAATEGEEDGDGVESVPTDEARAPRLGELLETFQALKPEERDAINERVNQIVRDRVTKVNARRDELKTQLQGESQARTAAEAKVQELEARGASAPAPGDNPLAKVTTEQALAEEQRKASRVIRECGSLMLEIEDNPQGVHAVLKANKIDLLDADGAPDYTPGRLRKELTKIRNNAEETLMEHIPARGAQIQQQRTFDAEAAQHFPELKDRNHAFTKKVNALLAKLPGIASEPYGRLFMANAVFGSAKLAELAKAAPAKQAAKPAVPPLAKAKVPKAKPQLAALPGAAKPRPTEGPSAQLKAAQDRFAEDGSDKNLEKLEAAEAAERANRRR